MKRFGAGDLPLGTFRAATDKWAENDTERRELGRVADIMDRHLAKRSEDIAEITSQRLIKRSLFGYSSAMTADTLAKRLNFGAPITVPRANFARKKAKPPKAGGKRRRWKKNRAVVANTRRVYQHAIDKLRHLTDNALGFNFGDSAT